MHLSPRRRSTFADLLRVAAAWLALVLLAQGMAAAHAMGSGPLHRHAGVVAAGLHHHDAAARHHHPSNEAGLAVPASSDDAVDTASFALTAALALLALAGLRSGSDPRRHVQQSALPWQPHPAWQALLQRPPRPC